MGRVIKKITCPSCKQQGNDTSGDNLAVYEDGSSYCFACGFTARRSKTTTATKDNGTLTMMMPTFNEITTDLLGLNKEVLNYYQCSLTGSNQINFPYVNVSNEVVKIKTRSFGNNGFNRDFRFQSLPLSPGQDSQHVNLFGWQLYQPKVHKIAVVFEGERDLLTFHTKYGKPTSYCYLALPGTGNANQAAIFLQQAEFTKILVVFDNDEAGKKAEMTFKSILGDRVYFNKNTLTKDISDSHESLPQSIDDFLDNFSERLPTPFLVQDSYKELLAFSSDLSTSALIDFAEELPSLNNVCRFRKGMFAMVCGDTGSGKSFFMDSLIIRAIQQNKKVLLVSLEMTPGECYARLLYQLTGQFITQEVLERDEPGIRDWCKAFDANLYVNTNAAPTVETIKAQLISLQGEVDIVIVDTISLFAGTLEWKDLVKESYELKKLALDPKVNRPMVIGVTQMSLRNKKKENVDTSDIFGAAGISQAPDFMLFLDTCKETSNTVFKVLKRDRAVGRYASFRAMFNFSTGCWQEVVNQTPAPPINTTNPYNGDSNVDYDDYI